MGSASLRNVGASQRSAFGSRKAAGLTGAANQGKHVVLVDMHTGFPVSELADGIHPNAAGYLRMANVWYARLGSLLN